PWPRRRDPAVPDARGARRRLRRPALGRWLRHRPRRPGLEEPAGRVHRDPLPAAGRDARFGPRLWRPRSATRRPRLPRGDPPHPSAHDDYGVVLARTADGAFAPDLDATAPLRQRLAAERDRLIAEGAISPAFDRGPGYRQLSGQPFADVD